jgi:4-amino-4-deoxy-L-arabinose transferase-like glycosyltransferase
MFRLPFTRPIHYALLLAVTALLTLPGLGSMSLWDVDEGLNAEAAREMYESGEWVVPAFNFQPRTAKPALLYWLQASCYKHFGVNEFSARIPSAVAMAVCVLLTYELGRMMFGAAAGLLAGIVLVSCVQVCVLAHAATPDAVLLAALLLTFTLFWHGYRRRGRLWLITTGPACGLAVLAKGPVGLALPVAVIGYFLLARRELRRAFDRRALIGLVGFLLVAAPWYVLVGVETRGAFLRSFWRTENVGRFAAPMEGHGGPVYYYLIVLMIGLAPWCVLLGPAVWNALKAVSPAGEALRAGRYGADRHWPARKASPTGETGALTFLLSWAAVWLGFFSLAQTKLPNYVLPVYPPIALLIAHYLDAWRRGRNTIAPAVWRVSLSGLTFIGVVTVIGLLIAGGNIPALRNRALPGIGTWAWLGSIPAIGAGLAAWHSRRDRRTALVTTLTTCAVAFVGALAALPPRAVEGHKAPRSLVAAAGARRPDAEVRIATFDYFQPSLVFYCEREVLQLFSEQQALDFLRGPLPAYLFCPSPVWDRLAPRAVEPVKLVARHRDLYRGCDIIVLSNH